MVKADPLALPQRAPTRIGARMNGGSPKDERRAHDNYPTPPGTTRAVLPLLEQIRWPQRVWECAAGEGHMVKQLCSGGYEVIPSDIRKVRGVMQLDFLQADRALAPSIVTNPPFELADEFIAHAIAILGIEYVAVVLPMNFWCAKTRAPLFEALPPAFVLPMTWRIDNTGEKKPTMTSMWCVWCPAAGARRSTVFRPLTTDEKNPGRF